MSIGTGLNRLRVKYNITCHDYKAQSNLERSNKRKRKLGQEEIQDTKNDEELMTVDYEYCGGDSSDDEDDNNAAMATLSCKYCFCFPLFPFMTCLTTVMLLNNDAMLQVIKFTQCEPAMQTPGCKFDATTHEQ